MEGVRLAASKLADMPVAWLANDRSNTWRPTAV